MTKQHLLNILARQDDLDAASVAQGLGCTRSAAGMFLVRLARQGLIWREFDPDDRVYFYNLTAKGRDRLAYLTQIEQKKR